jgi:hypothetical protein
LAIALATMTAPAWSQATLVSLEDGVEASTAAVSLPESVPARWSFRACPSCTLMNVDVDERTEFFIGRQAVSFAVLQKYAARGAAGLDIFFDPKTKRVTRVILRAELDAADQVRPETPVKR